ncbi:hypothetical protein Q7P37_006057 [Cladosporium fusiforme]
MKVATSIATLLTVALYATPAVSSPVPQDDEEFPEIDIDLKKHPEGPYPKLDSDEDKLARCTTNEREPGKDDVGKLLCQDITSLASGWPDLPYSCEECFGLDGNDPIKTSDKASCTIVTESDDGKISVMNKKTACPGDDVPEEDPDGNPSSDLAEGVIDAWCAAAGSGGMFGFPNMLACYGWAFSKNGDVLEQNKIGATLVCDTMFMGMCTFFQNTT